MKVMKSSKAICICFLLIGFLFFPTFITSFLFIFNIKINIFTLPLSITVLLAFYYYLFYKSGNKKNFYISLIISGIIIISILIISAFLLENSWDGWAYHTPAIIYLKNGYNPLYQHIEEYNIWSVHYPKFIWIYGSVLYKTFNNLFMGTSFNLIMMIATSFLSYDIIKKLKYSNTFSIITSIIIGFNIISLTQLFTYYNDGVLGNCIWCILLIFYALGKKLYRFESNYVILFLLTFFLSILANIKFTGALFAFLLVIIYFIYFLFIKIIKKNKFALISLLSISIGVLTVGINTYLPNFIYHDSIGYPLIGKEKRDIINYFVPEMLKNDSKYLSLIKSITYDVDYQKYHYQPFYIVDDKSIENSLVYDCRMGGFGPFFQMILIGSILILISSLMKNYIDERKFKIKENLNELLVIGFIFLFTLITPGIWWVRYIPYFYVFPLVLIIFFRKEWKIINFQTIMSYFVIAIYLIAIPVYLVNKVNIQITSAKKLNDEIKYLDSASKTRDLYISIYSPNVLSYKKEVRKELLKIYNIDYTEYETDKCEPVNYFYYLGISEVKCQK